MADLRDLILGLCPFERADADLVEAVCRSGALGILDLGRDPEAARLALARLSAGGHRFGVRLPAGVSLPELPVEVDTVVAAPGVRAPAGVRWLAEVTSEAEARTALDAGASGLVAKGHESGGRVGEEGAFVLLQRLVARTEVPVWVMGGVGLHTAAACIAGGARGVVLDVQLALARESTLPEPIREVLGGLDGSETMVLGGHRVFTRPDLPIDALAAKLPQSLGAGDLNLTLLPLGQDAFLAAPFARRFKTAGGIVRAVEASITRHLDQARSVKPLAPGSGLARELGLRVPVAQGPMTRVSDTAAFADAVAGEGGLPFLALSLMRGPQAKALLEETKARLGERTWGVGILGFVPPELRAEQLDVLDAIRPPVALIAGGRPAQARTLEQNGTRTFLHVPSPGLLDLFLKDGARRFVFEGRECGGHVGPRTSFALWEAQVEKLLALSDPETVEILFAGGIHDARSAAMVAAIAGPLAARGAKVGVLMGTAYLFTEEAVESGAILPGFQQAALGCNETRLLETSPGHATRCVESPYVTQFEKTRERLVADGKSQDEVWAELESLNLGRLRMAAKGVTRDGDALVEIDAESQAREGMFMIGQVAALRQATTTVGALHAEVSDGATSHLAAVDVPRRAGPRPAPADVAIVGMACFYPGAGDARRFWSNVVLARDAITEVPPERWRIEDYYDPDSNDGTKTPSKWGGFLSAIDFDPLDYGIPPRSLAAVEPVQLLALEVARRALDDAGYADRDFDRERTSVIFGAEAGTDLASAYGFRALWPQLLGELPEPLDEVLPSLTEDSFPGVLANVIAGRIANRLDLGGVNYTVDAACASSLAALDLACKELRAGSSDLVLCGGADLHNAIGDYLLFASTHALSRKGRCATFDSDADGIALGEGVAAIVLKRLEDAEKDGDRIYAVVRAVAGSSDGRALGLTAPRKEGQMRAVERAYAAAGVSPADVGLVEAHGTGTVVGDRTELRTLTDVYTAAGAEPGTVALGSVKSNVGHTKCAAGLAGLIKVAEALHRRVLPPTLHVASPNPAWDAASSPFFFPTEARPWTGPRRHAAVSAFGFGGTNFHAVLAPHGEPAAAGLADWPAELFLVRDAAELDRLAEHARAASPAPLRALARAASTHVEGPVRIAIVAASHEDLLEKIEAAKAGRAGAGVVLGDGTPPAGKVAFLFPGQGAQRPGMLAQLFAAFPRLGRFLDLGARYTARIFPPPAWDPATAKVQREALTDTRAAQPALGVVDLAAASLLDALGVRPDMAAGHSYGELVALCVAGAFDEATLIALSEARAEAILAAAGGDPGAMAAARVGAEKLAALDLGDVVLANLNAPAQTVLAGPGPAIDSALETLDAEGIAARRINVACAFHSPVVAGASEELAARLADAHIEAPRIPVYSNTHAAPYEPTADAVRKTLAEHVARPVRFVEEVRAMYDAGARIFVEAGPARIQSGLTDEILGDLPHLTVSLESPGRGGIESLLDALAALSVAGVPVDPAALYAGRDAPAVDLDAPPPAPRPSVWKVDGHRARPVVGEPPAFALKPMTRPLDLAMGAGAPSGEGEAVMIEYLRGVRETAERQRDVMLAWLGQAPVAGEVRARAHATVTVEATTVPEALPEAAEARPPREAGEVLLEVVSDRTGYPVAMLDLDLDLEADLSIDSIKRIEIIGVLSDELGLGDASEADRDRLVEALAAVKTLRGILAWLETEAKGAMDGEAQTGESDAAAQEEAVSADASPAGGPPNGAAKADAPDAGATAARVPPRAARFVLHLTDAPEPIDAWQLEGRRVAVAPGGGAMGAALAEALQAGGATVAPADAADVDALILVGGLEPATGGTPGSRLFDAADLARRALSAGAEVVLVATALGGRFGRAMNGHDPLASGGLAGLAKTIAKEWPEARVRCVDLDPDEDPVALTGHLLAELRSGDGLVEVGWYAGARRRLEAREVPLDAATGEALGEGLVVLLTGGARGITARAARALARGGARTLVLVGRSPRPEGDEPPELTGCDTAQALRGRLAAIGKAKTPAEAARLADRVLADREIRATLAALEADGATVEYHAVDVRDEDAFGALVDDVVRRHGRIDLAIHGAGVTEDKLLRDKTKESFQRVVDTKVVGARVLAERLPEDTARIVFFSSVASAFGNRGQSDYAAANDLLDKLAHALNGKRPGRVVSINWGPWAGGGMVSPDLEVEYDRRGIGLIDPDDGVERLLDELRADGEAQVILMRAEPEHLD